MPQSTVQICIEEQRAQYYKALSTKISDFKRYLSSPATGSTNEVQETEDIKRYLRDAISFKNMFDIKPAVVTLTRDDLNLLHRILDTSA